MPLDRRCIHLKQPKRLSSICAFGCVKSFALPVFAGIMNHYIYIIYIIIYIIYIIIYI